MPRSITALTLVSLSLIATACDTEENTMGEDFRSLDVDVSLTMADGGSDDGTILWEIGEGAVYEGLRINGDLLFYVEDNVIYNHEAEATCTINAPYLNTTIREVYAANGNDVLFTIWENYVFEGEIDLNKPQKWSQLKNEALFEYNRDEIFLGRANWGNRLVTANTNLEDQSRGRKLLIAALLTGDCGSAGLPGYDL